MVKKKFWVHYEQLKTIIAIYIALFFTILLLSLGFSYLAHSSNIENGIQGYLKIAMLSGLKWYGIIMPIVTVLFVIWFLYCSGTVNFTDTGIQIYSWFFSKKSREISYNEISQCVLAGRLWLTNRSLRRPRHRSIILYNKSNVVFTFDIYSKLAVMLVLYLGEDRFKLVSDKGNLKTLSGYYSINFMDLKHEEQLMILNHYCKSNHHKYKTGEEILNKKRK